MHPRLHDLMELLAEAQALYESAQCGLQQIDRTWAGGQRETIYPEAMDPAESR